MLKQKHALYKDLQEENTNSRRQTKITYRNNDYVELCYRNRVIYNNVKTNSYDINEKFSSIEQQGKQQQQKIFRNS